MKNEALVQQIERFRAERGWSICRLTRELGVKRTMIYYLLSGKRPVGRRTIMGVTKGLARLQGTDTSSSYRCTCGRSFPTFVSLRAHWGGMALRRDGKVHKQVESVMQGTVSQQDKGITAQDLVDAMINEIVSLRQQVADSKQKYGSICKETVLLKKERDDWQAKWGNDMGARIRSVLAVPGESALTGKTGH